MSRTPDYCEPVVAWRVWYAVKSEGKTHLSSVYHPTIWPYRRALEARCGRPRLPWVPFRRTPHLAPSERCLCGVYAGFAEEILDYLPTGWPRPTLHPVVGRVSLWGEVVECERGWRASRAYPERLYVPRLGLGDLEAEPLARGLEVYGVPVDVLDEATDDAAVKNIVSAVDECMRMPDRSGTVVIPGTWRFWER